MTIVMPTEQIPMIELADDVQQVPRRQEMRNEEPHRGKGGHAKDRDHDASHMKAARPSCHSCSPGKGFRPRGSSAATRMPRPAV